MIKLIGIDCDDTILNKDKEISDYNSQIISQANEKNIKCVLTTGRPFVLKTQEYYQKMNIFSENQYFIAYNGAAIYEVVTGKLITSTMLNYENIIEIHNTVKEYDVSHYIHQTGMICYDVMNEYSFLEKKFNNLELKQINFEKLNKDEKAFKYMIAGEASVIKEIHEKIPNQIKEKYNVVISMPCFLEFMDKKVNKWTGLCKLANILNIDKEEIMAIGDSMNDYEMIKNAKIGVAMKNSVSEIIKIADYVTDTNDNDGVGKIINEILFF